jgi:hypothetical protein
VQWLKSWHAPVWTRLKITLGAFARFLSSEGVSSRDRWCYSKTPRCAEVRASPAS